MAAEAIPAFLHVPEVPGEGATLRLGSDDSHYVARVCRVRAGERFSVTDGRGRVARILCTDAARGVVGEVEAVELVAAPPEARILCGAPEGERADWMVEKLAELGVTRLTPVDCERGAWERFARRAGRLERVASAALRQSRRAHLLALDPPRPLAEALEGLPAGAALWLAGESGEAPPSGGDPSPGTVGLIGPSSGLTGAEIASTRAFGFRAISLAGARLRTETAAIAMAAWWASRSAGSRLGS